MILTQRPLFRTLAAALALLVPLEGCHSWRIEPLEPQQAASPPRTMRVTLKNGEQQVLQDAVLKGDSLVGRYVGYQGFGYSHAPPERHALATRDIAWVEVTQPSPGRTALLVVALVGAYVALLAVSHADLAPGSWSLNVVR
jgi:hypothetical protein